MKSFSYLVGRDGILKNSKIMDFIFKPSWKTTSIEGWLSRFSKSKKNEDGRSAKTLAEFCKTNDAEKIIVDILNPIVGDVNSIEAYPEYHTKIDKFGKGRMHDLAIKCKENEVFVGIEAITKKKVKKNKCKLCVFLQAIKAIKTINNRSAEYYEATLNGKKLNIVNAK